MGRWHPLFELRLPLECYPATPTRSPQRPSPLMGFGSLQHLKNPRSTSRGLSPPAMFRLQGLATLLTACSLESRASFISHRRRSWDSPFGGFTFLRASPALSAWTDPPTVSLVVVSDTEVPDRTDTPRFLGLSLSKVPCNRRRFNPTITGASHGFRPSRAIDEGLDPDFSRSPLTRFAGSGDCSPNPPASQSIDQPSLRFARGTPKRIPAKATLMGFSHLSES